MKSAIPSKRTEDSEKRFLKHAKITSQDSGWRLRAK